MTADDHIKVCHCSTEGWEKGGNDAASQPVEMILDPTLFQPRRSIKRKTNPLGAVLFTPLDDIRLHAIGYWYNNSYNPGCQKKKIKKKKVKDAHEMGS